MPYHSIAYYATSASVTADTQINAVSGDPLTISSNSYVYIQPLKVLSAFAQGLNLKYARINTPSLRAIAIPYLNPLSVNALSGNYANACDFSAAPIQLAANEPIEVDHTGTSTSGQVFVLLDVTDNITPIIPSQVFMLRGTSSTAVSALTWSQLTMTWTQSLPGLPYTFGCIGGFHVSTNSLAARLQFPGQFFQPGFPGLQVNGQRLPDPYSPGRHGLLGTFTSITIPNVWVFAGGADATHDVGLWFVRLS
jgi:hypothetical protein